MLALDMLLGNADRLVCEPLGWRGNAGNVLQAKRGRRKGRIVAIDALVQRRPPNGLVSAEESLGLEEWYSMLDMSCSLFVLSVRRGSSTSFASSH